MPRSYARKTSRALSYSKEDLRIAVERVRNGELSNFAAATLYGIPKSTLNDRVLKKTGLSSETLGRPPAIPFAMEERLAECLRVLEKWGWGLSRRDVIHITSQFIKENKINTPFKYDTPGPDWFIAFRKRHKLSIKKPQPVEYLRKRMTDPFVIHEYFNLLEKTLNELNLHDPNRIWNSDETSVALDPTKTKVVGGVGLPCTRTTAGSGKENITVLTTVNAAGRKLDPLIVYKGVYVYEQWLAKKKEEYEFQIAYAASKRGWMETDIFFNYMKKIVIPGLGEQRPVLLVYDGHSTHVNPEVVTLARESNITILKLPAHTSHLLQPLDLAVFKSFKSIWDQRLTEWQRQNIGTKLRKQAFAEIFAETWHLTSPKVIQSGFKKGGIYPFNANVIPVEKYDPHAYKRWMTSQKKLQKVKTLKELCLQLLNNNMNPATRATTNLVCTSSDLARAEDIGNNTTFEELLLMKLSQSSRDTRYDKNAVKLKRVAKGAEVITRAMLENSKEKQLQDINTQKDNQKPKRKKQRETKSTSTYNAPDLSVPGPSNISKKNTKQLVVKTLGLGITTDKINNNVNTTSTAKGKGIGKKTKNKSLGNVPGTCYLNIPNNTTECKMPYEKPTSYEKLKMKKKSVKIPKKKKKRREGNISSTTSESDEISIHSDSDIFSDGFSDREKESLVVKEKTNPFNEISHLDEADETIGQDLLKLQNINLKTGKKEKLQMGKNNYKIVNKKRNVQAKNFAEEIVVQVDDTYAPDLNRPANSSKNSDDNQKVTVLSSVSFRPENYKFVGLETCKPLQLNKININFDVSESGKRKATQSQIVNKENILVKNSKQRKLNDKQDNDEEKWKEKYNIGDTILVRYYTKCWKYYVGVIENINFGNQRKYSVRYYKSVGKKGEVKFSLPKRKDYDTVPDVSIVKKIDLLQINDNPEEYILFNDADATYF